MVDDKYFTLRTSKTRRVGGAARAAIFFAALIPKKYIFYDNLIKQQ